VEWMRRSETSQTPLFVSLHRLLGVKRLRPAKCSWALDSGGFTELKMHGKWTISPKRYVWEAQYLYEEVGGLEWLATQDWMCEPEMLAKTGLSVREHQKRSVESYMTLTKLDPSLPWVPVLQGWAPDDYLTNFEDYLKMGVKLEGLPRVGIGSVCRRQHTEGVEGVVRELHTRGVKLHAFGMKTRGLAVLKDFLVSSDSMAWSFQARRSKVLMEGCTGHSNCANCLRYALHWRANMLRKIKA
jgi:hypothetical protein